MPSLAPRSLPRRLAVVALAGVLGLAASGCSGSDAEGGDGSGAEVGDAATLQTTTTVEQPTASTSTTEAPTTTAAPTVAVGRPEAEGAAQALYDAWKAGDRVAAGQVADPAAIEGIWLTTPGDYSLYNNCDTGEFATGGCLFRGDTGTIQIDLEKRGDNWVVATVFYADL